MLQPERNLIEGLLAKYPSRIGRRIVPAGRFECIWNGRIHAGPHSNKASNQVINLRCFENQLTGQLLAVGAAYDEFPLVRRDGDVQSDHVLLRAPQPIAFDDLASDVPES